MWNSDMTVWREQAWDPGTDTTLLHDTTTVPMTSQVVFGLDNCDDNDLEYKSCVSATISPSWEPLGDCSLAPRKPSLLPDR